MASKELHVLLVMAVGEEAMETMLSMATNPEVRQALEEAPDLSSVFSADVIQQVVEEIRSWLEGSRGNHSQ